MNVLLILATLCVSTVLAAAPQGQANAGDPLDPVFPHRDIDWIGMVTDGFAIIIIIGGLMYYILTHFSFIK